MLFMCPRVYELELSLLNQFVDCGVSMSQNKHLVYKFKENIRKVKFMLIIIACQLETFYLHKHICKFLFCAFFRKFGP